MCCVFVPKEKRAFEKPGAVGIEIFKPGGWWFAHDGHVLFCINAIDWWEGVSMGIEV